MSQDGVPVLRSYTGGSWRTGDGDGTPLHDAVTGELMARVSSAGIDMGAALGHGRRVGGPALRELTFHQRAALLKALAGHLREHRDELYALSARAGATLDDAKFDVDGGIGVLNAYASLGRRELPNDTVYVDGTAQPLSRGGAFAGQHIGTSRPGVAVQINAFNFPVWGPLEKLAPAFLAGMPSLIKPASQTAHLTEKLVELIVTSGLLPAGTVQLICGSAGDLLDHLTEQDMVSFTGSAATAQRLRTHPAVVRHAVPFNAEADSLNCSILGPDATPGSVEFDLYVDQLVTEMTVKAGQKCTAIRRAFVPADRLDDVAAAVTEQLAQVVVGNPADPAVRMGALASLEQREEVRRSLKALAEDVLARDESAMAGGWGHRRRITLFHGARTPLDLYEMPELRDLERTYPWLTVVPVISDDETFNGHRGSVCTVAVGHGDWLGHEAYLAGPPEMITETERELVKAGVPAEHIHHD